MDFTNRAARPAQAANQAPVSGGAPAHHNGSGSTKNKGSHKNFASIATLVLVFSVAFVVAGLTWLSVFYKGPNEARFLDSNKYQAVFLNGGQVYFGKISSLNNSFVRVNDIYYLRVNQQVQPKQGEQPQQDISLVKLGCELHGPQDQMVVNREQVVFWENLKDDGQVAKAIKQYKDANPGEQKCETPQQNSGTDESSTPAGGNGEDTGGGEEAETETP